MLHMRAEAAEGYDAVGIGETAVAAAATDLTAISALLDDLQSVVSSRALRCRRSKLLLAAAEMELAETLRLERETMEAAEAEKLADELEAMGCDGDCDEAQTLPDDTFAVAVAAGSCDDAEHRPADAPEIDAKRYLDNFGELHRLVRLQAEEEVVGASPGKLETR